MKQLRDWLYIGDYIDLKSISDPIYNNINAILNLAEDFPIENKKSLDGDLVSPFNPC